MCKSLNRHVSTIRRWQELPRWRLSIPNVPERSSTTHDRGAKLHIHTYIHTPVVADPHRHGRWPPCAEAQPLPGRGAAAARAGLPTWLAGWHGLLGTPVRPLGGQLGGYSQTRNERSETSDQAPFEPIYPRRAVQLASWKGGGRRVGEQSRWEGWGREGGDVGEARQMQLCPTLPNRHTVSRCPSTTGPATNVRPSSVACMGGRARRQGC